MTSVYSQKKCTPVKSQTQKFFPKENTSQVKTRSKKVNSTMNDDGEAEHHEVVLQLPNKKKKPNMDDNSNNNELRSVKLLEEFQKERQKNKDGIQKSSVVLEHNTDETSRVNGFNKFVMSNHSKFNLSQKQKQLSIFTKDKTGIENVHKTGIETPPKNNTREISFSPVKKKLFDFESIKKKSNRVNNNVKVLEHIMIGDITATRRNIPFKGIVKSKGKVSTFIKEKVENIVLTLILADSTSEIEIVLYSNDAAEANENLFEKDEVLCTSWDAVPQHKEMYVTSHTCSLKNISYSKIPVTAKDTQLTSTLFELPRVTTIDEAKLHKIFSVEGRIGKIAQSKSGLKIFLISFTPIPMEFTLYPNHYHDYGKLKVNDAIIVERLKLIGISILPTKLSKVFSTKDIYNEHALNQDDPDLFCQKNGSFVNLSIGTYESCSFKACNKGLKKERKCPLHVNQLQEKDSHFSFRSQAEIYIEPFGIVSGTMFSDVCDDLISLTANEFHELSYGDKKEYETQLVQVLVHMVFEFTMMKNKGNTYNPESLIVKQIAGIE